MVFSQDKPKTCYQYVNWAEFCYNICHNESIHMVPFLALYGRTPPTIPPYVPHSTPIQALEELFQGRTELLKSLKENLQRARHRMAQKANKKRREVEYAVGYMVLLKLQPYKQQSVAKRLSDKLSKRYFSPFEILE